MSFSRRDFMKTGGALAAGAALGTLDTVKVPRGLVQYGPVTLQTPFFLSKEPLKIPAIIHSNERENVFKITTYDDQGKRVGSVECSLKDLQAALLEGTLKTTCQGLSQSDVYPLAIIFKGARVTFVLNEGTEDGHPFWLDRADVLKVL